MGQASDGVAAAAASRDSSGQPADLDSSPRGADLVDGAADVASEGFFDLWNLPPWDTWIAFGTRPTTERERSEASFLISWVPSQLLEHADAGVAVNPEQCITWLDDHGLARLLAAARMP